MREQEIIFLKGLVARVEQKAASDQTVERKIELGRGKSVTICMTPEESHRVSRIAFQNKLRVPDMIRPLVKSG